MCGGVEDRVATRMRGLGARLSISARRTCERVAGSRRRLFGSGGLLWTSGGRTVNVYSPGDFDALPLLFGMVGKYLAVLGRFVGLAPGFVEVLKNLDDGTIWSANS